MRSGFWVVLGLVGVLPLGALAREEQEQPAGQAPATRSVSNEALQQQINELWQGIRELQQQVPGSGPVRPEAPVARRAGQEANAPEPASRAAIGGSGTGGGESRQASVPPDADVYVGWVRALEGGRLLLVERTGNVYELGVDERTRIIGDEGRSVSSRALKEGTLVRAVATEGEERDQVRGLYILALPLPER